MALRDFLRAVTLGAPQRQMRRELVKVRDSSKPKVLEVELDEEGKAVLVPLLDEKQKPVFDDDGKPVMKERSRYRYPPRLDDEGKPALIEVREPGLKLRAEIYRAAGLANVGDDRQVDMAALQVSACIALAYEPGSNTKIFSDADRPALMAQLSGGFVDDIFEVAQPLMNAADEGDVAKN